MFMKSHKKWNMPVLLYRLSLRLSTEYRKTNMKPGLVLTSHFSLVSQMSRSRSRLADDAMIFVLCRSLGYMDLLHNTAYEI